MGGKLGGEGRKKVITWLQLSVPNSESTIRFSVDQFCFATPITFSNWFRVFKWCMLCNYRVPLIQVWFWGSAVGLLGLLGVAWYFRFCCRLPSYHLPRINDRQSHYNSLLL